MKSCNEESNNSLTRDTHKSEKQTKLPTTEHSKLYLLTYVKPRYFRYFI